MSNTEYTLVFGLGPKANGSPNTDVDIAIAIAAIEDASLQLCGGFTLHRGKGGWMDPNNKIVKEDVAILMVSGSLENIQKIAAIGKGLLGPTAVYVKKPDGSTSLL
ncbi:MAG: hypothetical protein B7Y80_08195 [Hyphomicrobium sp. 32-62-53]|nr:MAG: hypothetical protein B7Z29_16145 [Hyphomicrobium sp. 12-62-95]OYY00119.1 MAG: hypothetical protein B7Y80_08195 [Hyphomicrobium sp. 32-62-53]